MAEPSAELKLFLHRNLYRHTKVVEKMTLAQQVVRELFAAYMNDLPRFEPASHAGPRGTASQSTAQLKPARWVADYIAGMTDRFAAKEHERLGLGRVNFG